MKSDFTKFRGFSPNKGQNRFYTLVFFPFDLLRLSVKVCFGSAIVIFRRTACNKGQEIQMSSEAKDKFKIT